MDREWSEPAAAAWLFGSTARGDGSRESDIDIIAVSLRKRTNRWEQQIAGLVQFATDLTGNDVHLIDYDTTRFRALVRSENPLVRSLRTEGIELLENSAAALKQPRLNQRRTSCGPAAARTRHASAVAFIDAVDKLALLDCDRDVVVTNAVMAGIAASDALCCTHLGERSADQDHAAATRLLARIDPNLANDLGRLLALKTTAAYETRSISAADARSGLRRARKLVDAATNAISNL